MAESPWLAVFCSGLLGPETGVCPAYGFVVVSCVGFPKRLSRGSLETLEPRWSSQGGGGDRNSPTGYLEWEIFHSHAALLEDGPDGGLHPGFGEKTLLAVSEHRAALAALGWLEGRGYSGERIVLFTESRSLANREEEPFGLRRAARRKGEGASSKEVLCSLSRFEDLSVAWWRLGDPEGVGETGSLASEAAAEISARGRVAVLEEGRRERAKDVKLEKVGRGLYRANDSYLVDAILGLCACRDFERHNGRKRKKAGRPRTSIGISGGGAPQIPALHLPLLVRCKHLIAAEEAERQAERRAQDPASVRNALPDPLGLGARPKPRGGGSRGGQKP